MTSLVMFAIVAVSPLAVFWLFCNIVSSMPSGDDWAKAGKSPAFVLLWGWAYTLLHLIAGNAAHIFPSLRMTVGNGDGK